MRQAVYLDLAKEHPLKESKNYLEKLKEELVISWKNKMAKIKFSTGEIVNFDGIPTPEDIEEVAEKLGIGKTDSIQPPLKEDLTPSTITQKAGSIPTKSTFKQFLPTKEEIPELTATILAGLKSSKLATLPAAGAVGTAALSAEIGKQIYEPFRESPQIPTPTEALKRQGMAFARGALGESASRG